MNGDLTGSGSECKAFKTVDITDIGFLEICIGICADGVSGYIYLDISL